MGNCCRKPSKDDLVTIGETADVKGMSAGATITKSYDTECVQNVLGGK